MLDAIVAATWRARREAGLRGEIGRVVDQIVLHDLIALSRSPAASAQSRAIASAEIQALRTWAAGAAARTGDAAERAHLAYAVQQIAELEREPRRIEAPPAEPPDGPPIGAPDADDGEP